MGNLRTFDRRRGSRHEADIGVMVWGVDTRGDRFLQEARAREISLSGALLCELDAELRSGDVIGILYSGQKARYRVVGVRFDDFGGKLKAAVQRMEPDICPWRELLAESPPSTPLAANASTV
jgi:hypothetical protein